MSKLNITQPAVSASGAIAPATYSGLSILTPSAYTGQSVLVTDIGVNGTIFTSNGTKWVPLAKIQLINAGAGWIVPSLAVANAATYTQTGTEVTVTSTGHNIPVAENGAFVYLAISSGLATAGWFSNFTYVNANTFTCTSSVSQSTSGSINTNTSETVITPLSATIIGGLLGKNGTITIDMLYQQNNNANSKTKSYKIGGNVIYTSIVGTIASGRNVGTLRNKNSFSSQLQSTLTTNTSTSIFTGYSIDTSLDVPLIFTVQCSSASDYVGFKSVNVEVNYNDN